MKKKIPSGSKRDKTALTPKQNKHKNPQYARKSYSFTCTGMSKYKAGKIIEKRVKGIYTA